MTKKFFVFTISLIFLLAAFPVTALAESDYRELPSFTDEINSYNLNVAKDNAVVIYVGDGQYYLIISKQVNSSSADFLSNWAPTNTNENTWGGFWISMFGSCYIYSYNYNTSQTDWVLSNSYVDKSGTKEIVSPTTTIYWPDSFVYCLNLVTIKNQFDGKTILKQFLPDDSIYTVKGTFVDGYTPGGSGGDSGGSGSSGEYNSFLQRIINILLYGNADGKSEDVSSIEENQNFLDSLNNQLLEVTEKLNLAPDYISSGFKSLEDSQAGINDVISGLNSYAKPLYYGICGVFVILVIRKVIGR